MAQTTVAYIQGQGGSLHSLSLLSGNSMTRLFCDFAATGSTWVTDNNGNLIGGQTVTLADGSTAYGARVTATVLFLL